MNLARRVLMAPGQPVGLAQSTPLRVVTAAAALLAGIAFSLDPPMSQGFTEMFTSGAAVIVLATACVWLSGLCPVLALVGAAALCAAAPIVSASSAALELVTVVVVLQATLSTELNWRICAGVSVVSLGVNDLALRTSTGESWWGSGLLYPWILSALAVGLGLQARRLHAAVVELRRLRELDQERARIDERRRIARDLHDVAAHHLTALVVRNKLARRQATFESLERAAMFSATTAAEALEALRQVVGVENRGDRSPAALDGEQPPLAPQPTLGDLPAIISRCSSGGLDIVSDIAVDGGLRRDVEIAIVRLVQEALSNVLAHRGPGAASVTISSVDDNVRVVVANPMRSSTVNPHTPRTGGLGLVAMRERVEACGGSLTAGIDRSTWAVSAAFPSRTKR